MCIIQSIWGNIRCIQFIYQSKGNKQQLWNRARFIVTNYCEYAWCMVRDGQQMNEQQTKKNKINRHHFYMMYSLRIRYSRNSSYEVFNIHNCYMQIIIGIVYLMNIGTQRTKTSAHKRGEILSCIEFHNN